MCLLPRQTSLVRVLLHRVAGFLVRLAGLEPASCANLALTEYKSAALPIELQAQICISCRKKMTATLSVSAICKARTYSERGHHEFSDKPVWQYSQPGFCSLPAWWAEHSRGNCRPCWQITGNCGAICRRPGGLSAFSIRHAQNGRLRSAASGQVCSSPIPMLKSWQAAILWCLKRRQRQSG